VNDRRVLKLLSDAFVGGIKSAMPLIQTEMNVIIGDRNNQLKAMGGREVAYFAADGFKVSAVILAPPGKRRFRAAVGLVNPDEPFDAWDSLATRLRSAGTAVILVEARGSGRSRSAGIPSPETWRGNEAALEELVAQDLSLAVRALAQAVPVDTSRVLLIAGLQGATAAAEAAARDPRFHALLLASPTPHPVDQGRAIANLARRRLLIYITNAPTDVYPYSMSVSDLLLHASDERASRISDSLRPGPGVMLFRSDPQAFPRFRQWMEETWARPAPKAGVRPTR
jgi:pimeloyl-ACP methyl ester carboxylesterase